MAGEINEVSEAIGELKTEVKHLSHSVEALTKHVDSLNRSKNYSIGFMSGISAVISAVVFGISHLLKGH